MGEEEINQGGNSSNLIPSQVKPSKRSNQQRRRRPKNKQTNHEDAPNKNENPKSQNNGGDDDTKKAENIGPNTKPKAGKGSDDEKKKKNGKQTKRNNNNKKSNKRKRFPWRKEIPEGTVDPISLDPLKALPYPPFALMISPPYEAIPEWPIPINENNGAAKGNDSVDPAKREQQLISEQWHGILQVSGSHDNKNSSDPELKADSEHKMEQSREQKQNKHFHLFDGRVLAVYLVSTLQFIDPLNRRDLTRQEVVNLDNYLAKHRLKKMRVLEAYDDKGVTLSTAGANSQTPSGRLQIRQEEARNLLNALFGGQQELAREQREGPTRTRRDGRNGRDRNSNNAMSQQYTAHQTSEVAQQSNLRATSQYNDGAISWDNDGGIYADGGGFLMIDDDYNPGLRSGLNHAVEDTGHRSHHPRPTSDAIQMASWYGHQARNRADNFPALSSAPPSISNGQSDKAKEGPSKTAPVSKSLVKIGNLVQKTNSKQLEKQRKARDLARRKAEVASMVYEDAVQRLESGNGFDSSAHGLGNGSILVPALSNAREPTNAQLERNRNLASALGVKPSTRRAQISGWARPTDIPKNFDDFGNELNCIEFPDSLIIEAMERITELVRLEKKWLSFLKDDNAASCPLKPMDRPTRKFVHEYSDFWNIYTESYDPQPKRYIHCAKLLETRAPRPLLSEAVRKWRGPAVPSTFVQLPPSSCEKFPEQPAGEDSASFIREFVQTEERVPLDLKPRVVPPPGAMFDLESMNENELQITNEAQQPFAPILTERERPKLSLGPRTKPLELPRYQPPPSVNGSELAKNYEMTRNVALERKMLKEQREQSLLTAAFASDDEDSDSEWEVEDAVVIVDDDE
jgi:hypothetical protein